jgi:hypothetical protein
MPSYKRVKRSSRSRKGKSKSRKTSRKMNSRSRRGGKVTLVKIAKSPRSEKKYRAHFSDGTHTDFGAAGMSDYTKHKDADRKKRYESRHKRRENWSSPKSAGALSKWILWNKPSLQASISDYRRRFGM